ncbi:hypothetical protein [Ureaplasma ceti]|uniref:Uncharacterized protein n=1 Tax=Ureaplasma ceti TaxID=3119530 RepID=A0ABP9U629_9BACT
MSQDQIPRKFFHPLPNLKSLLVHLFSFEWNKLFKKKTDVNNKHHTGQDIVDSIDEIEELNLDNEEINEEVEEYLSDTAILHSELLNDAKEDVDDLHNVLNG